jgi:hypothetical protein
MNQFANAHSMRRKLAENPNGLRIAEVLSYTELVKSTDPKDRIYAVLGMVRPEDRAAVRVDYSDKYAARQLFIDVAKYCVQCQDTMKMLENCHQTEQALVLPSWVPRWTGTTFSSLYKCGGETRVDALVDTVNETLTLHGIDLDRIQHRGPGLSKDNVLIGTWPFNDPRLKGLSAIIFIERAATVLCENIFRKHGHYRTRETPDEVVRRTTTADQGFSGQRAATEDKMSFQHYRETVDRALSTWYVRRFRKSFAQAKVKIGETDAEKSMRQTWDDYKCLTLGALGKSRQDWEASSSTFLSDLQNNMSGQRLIVTETGMLGIGPLEAKEGDLVAMFHGSRVPFILKDVGDHGYTVIGGCYVHGVMDGEEFTKPGCNDRSRKFVLK